MYINAGYLNNSLVDFMDKENPLVVSCCGTYHIYTKERVPTYRPNGRLDYQLLYIASGKGHFYFNKTEETTVPAGHIVLYRPRELQKYVYYAEDQTEVYWVHFTGNQVNRLLKEYGFPAKGHVMHCGVFPEYQHIFQSMIQELRLCKPHYEQLLSVLMQQLLITVSRHTQADTRLNTYTQNEIEKAIGWFHEHYAEEINIESFAESKNMSVSWFIRNFKHYTGVTPLSYILSLRITNARHLLQTTSYNVTEISAIVGYDNPLYFSRLFKKETGLSPSEFRKKSVSQTS